MPQTSISSLCLQPELKELLIECVKERPAIWDSSCDEYADTNARRRAYLEVAKILGDRNNSQYKPSEIQVEWKKIRDVFNRTLKKVMQSNGRYEIGWRYFDQIKFIASPEQQLFLRQKCRDSSTENSSIDPYGIRHFLENANNDENSSLFKDNEDSLESNRLSLDWIAARCAEQQNDNASVKNDESSSYDEPLTTTQNGENGDNEDEEERSILPKKRSRIQPNSNIKRPQPHNDAFDAFGAFVSSQLRAVSRRNRLAGADLQRSILEICLKSELEN